MNKWAYNLFALILLLSILSVPTLTHSQTPTISSSGKISTFESGGFGLYPIQTNSITVITTIGTTIVTFTVTYLYYSLSSGVKAVLSFTGADIPINVSSSATSWKIIGASVTPYYVNGTKYPYSVPSPVYAYTSNQIILEGNYNQNYPPTWYVNVSYTLNITYGTSYSEVTLTVPYYFLEFAQYLNVTFPEGTYYSGEQLPFFITNLGTVMPSYYSVYDPMEVQVTIGGKTYTLPAQISLTTPGTYQYIINVSEDGYVANLYTNTITILSEYLIGGGVSFPYSPYSLEQIHDFTVISDEIGQTFQYANWFSPVTVSGTSLIIVPFSNTSHNYAYIPYNSSIISMNWSIEAYEISGPGGQLMFAFDTNTIRGYPNPSTGICDTGVMLYLEQYYMSSVHLISIINGQYEGINISVGSLSAGKVYTLGFTYSNGQFTFYWYNGTWYKFTYDAVMDIPPSTSEFYNKIGFNFNNCYEGGTDGYGEWALLSFSYVKPVPVYLEESYLSYPISSSLHTMLAYYGAYNPIVITTNATSWKVNEMTYKAYYITQQTVPIPGLFYESASSSHVYIDFIPDIFPLETWYMNVTITFNVTDTVAYDTNESALINVTIPIFFAEWIEFVEFYLPNASYNAGPLVLFNATYGLNVLPTYTVQYPIYANITIDGVTHSLPYETAFLPSATTQYQYTITVTEAGITLYQHSGTFTVIAPQPKPFIFASYTTPDYYQSNANITFETTEGLSYANITSFPFVTGTVYYTYLVIQNKSVYMLLNVSSTSFTFLFELSSSFESIPSTSFNLGVNNVTLDIVNDSAIVYVNGNKYALDNTSPIMGIGMENPPAHWWFYEYGAYYPVPVPNQPYTISTGLSSNTLSQVYSGYTDNNGFATVSINLYYYPYELVNIYWFNQISLTLNITVLPPKNSPFNTSVYSQPTLPKSSIYNFSQDQPWASIIGVVVIAVVAILGWKFANTPGMIGGGVGGTAVVAYLGLLPLYIYGIVIFALAMATAKVLVDRLMGGEM